MISNNHLEFSMPKHKVKLSFILKTCFLDIRINIRIRLGTVNSLMIYFKSKDYTHTTDNYDRLNQL